VTYELEREEDNDCFIINSAETLLVVERAVYGGSLFNFEPDRINGLAAGSMVAKSDLPDYYPWQSPPYSASVSETRIIGWGTRSWLRYGTRDETEEFTRQDEEDKEREYS
jgi:hypothetical protein